MSALQEFIDEHNSWGSLFKNHTPWEMPKTRRDAEPMFMALEGKLSPENLHCDGEISPAAAQREYRRLMKVYDELVAIVGHRELVY